MFLSALYTIGALVIFGITSVPYISSSQTLANENEYYQALIVVQYFAQMFILIFTIYFLR